MTTPVLTQCAAPAPSEIPNRAADLAAQLSLTSTRLAETVGLPLHPWEPEQRDTLDAQCDALIAQAYGCDDFAIKPVSVATLLAKVDRFCRADRAAECSARS